MRGLPDRIGGLGFLGELTVAVLDLMVGVRFLCGTTYLLDEALGGNRAQRLAEFLC